MLLFGHKDSEKKIMPANKIRKNPPLEEIICGELIHLKN